MSERIQMAQVSLHAPHFHITGPRSAVNAGDKLSIEKHDGLKMEWDFEDRMLYVTLCGEEQMIPESNIKSMWPKKEAKPIDIKTADPVKVAVNAKPTAQVVTPQSHVHAGPGHGKR